MFADTLNSFLIIMGLKNAGNRPSTSRVRSRSCCVMGRKNGDYKLSKWRESHCDVHSVNHNEEKCDFEAPF